MCILIKNDFKLDSSNYNFCGSECSTKYILKPDNICSNTCDESIFIVKNNNECGLCKDLDNENIYKMYNEPVCLKIKPNNSIYINEELKIIDCDKNYKYYNGNCIPQCHDNCGQCTIYSKDNNDQKCLTCKDETLFLENGNCVEACSSHYFLNNKNCKECDSSCKSCDKASNNCTSCYNETYLDETLETHYCIHCNDNCEACEFSEDNCISCKQSSSFKYLFNNSCYQNCPKNTIFNITLNECEEIKKNDDKEDKEDQENSKTNSKDSIMLAIFLTITGVLLFMILFCFYRRFCCNRKKSNISLLNEINTELREDIIN